MPNLVGLGRGLRIYITHVLPQEANDGITGSFFEALSLERFPVFLEVGLKGSRDEVISRTKSILGVKHTGFSGCICRHPAPWCGSMISHAESPILNTQSALPPTPHLDLLSVVFRETVHCGFG